MSVTMNSSGVGLSLSWNVQASNTGAPATVNSGSWNPKHSFTSGAGAGQANDYVQVINTLAGGANTTYDLTSSFGDLVGSSSVTINTIREFVCWLLSTSQTGPDGATTGTTGASITIGNAASVQAFTAAAPNGFFGASTHTGNVMNGGYWAMGLPSSGGFTAGASFKNLKVVNNDGSNVATFVLTFIIT